MRALIEVIDGGIGNSIQDRGRLGFRHMGITVSGWIDPMLARCANALVGNEANSACIEIRGAGPTLVAREGRFRVVLTGDVSALLTKENGATREVPAWTSFTLEANDTLEVGYIAGGTAYLAVGGGIDTPLQLGSRSTYQRALIGGVDGRPLATGNPTGSSTALAVFGVTLAVSSREALQRQAAPLGLDAATVDQLATAAGGRARQLPAELVQKLAAAGVDAKDLVQRASAEGLDAALSNVGIVLAALVALALLLSLRLPRASPPPAIAEAAEVPLRSKA